MKPTAPLVFRPRRPLVLQPQPDAVPPAPLPTRAAVADTAPPASLFGGGFLSLSALPAALLAFAPPPAMSRAEPPPALGGLVQASSALPASVASSATPTLAVAPGRQEEPPPRPGQVLLAGSWTPSVAPAPRPPIVAVARQDERGAVTTAGNLVAGFTLLADDTETVPLRPITASQAAPAPPAFAAGSFFSAGNLVLSVAASPLATAATFARAEEPTPYPGRVSAAASRTPQADVPPVTPPRFISREEPPPAPGQSWGLTSRTLSVFPPPPGVTGVAFARAEEPHPYPGRVLAAASRGPAVGVTPPASPCRFVAREEPPPPPGRALAHASRVVALDTGAPVVGPRFISREEPPPGPGSVRTLAGLTPYTDPLAPPPVMVRQEPPAPFAGSAWTIPQWPLTPTPVTPRFSLLRQQDRVPDPGRVVAFVSLASVAPPPPPGRASLVARQEAPPPFPGQVWVGPQGLISLPVLGDRRAEFFRREEPVSEAGRFVGLVSVASITTPPRVTSVLIARQEPPLLPGSAWKVPPPALVVPYTPPATRALIASREEPPPFAGDVLAWQPVVLASVFTPPARTVFARQEFSPSGGTVFLPIAREASPVLDTGVAVIARQEPPPPFPGSTILRPGNVRPSADPRPTRSVLPPADAPPRLEGRWLHRFPVIDSTGPMAVDFVAAPLALWLSSPSEVCVHAGAPQLFDVSDDFLFFDFIEEVQYERRDLKGMVVATYCCMALARAFVHLDPSMGLGAVAASGTCRWHIQASTLPVVPRRGDRIISRTKGTWEVAGDNTETWLSRYMCNCRNIEDA